MQAPPATPGPDPSVPLRVGVVGTGHWARWCHGTGLAARPDVELVGFYGRSLDRAREAAADVSGEAFDDLDALLERVDALSFAVAPDVQADIAVRAGAAGKHLLLDKPLALDTASAAEVVRATEGSGVAVLSFMTFLFADRVRTWLEDLRVLADEHGPWVGFAATFTSAMDAPGSPYAQSAWRLERGGLWDLGPHLLALAGALLPPVETVAAIRGLRDNVTMTTTHRDGSTATLAASVHAHPGTELAEAQVWGPGGRHRVELPMTAHQQAYDAAVAAWLGLVRGADGPDLGARYGLDVVGVLEAAERSIVDGRRLPVR